MEETEFKFSVDWTKPVFYCGLDVHKYELAVAVYSRDDCGSVFLKTNVFSMDSKGFESFWRFVKKYRPHGFAMEATGIYHHMVFKFLKSRRSRVRWPFKILVVNPADVSGIPGRQKNDKIDAEHLARYLSMGLLRNGRPIVESLEDLKSIFRMASRLEGERTSLKNRIKKTLDRAGIRPRRLNLNNDWVLRLLQEFITAEGSFGKFIRAYLKDQGTSRRDGTYIKKHLNDFAPYFEFSLTSAQKALIRQDLIDLNLKTARKSLLAVEVDQIILERPGLRKKAHDLATVPGLSPFSAAWILAETGGSQHFPSVRKFIAYCGCCPRVVSSAGKVYSAHVSRHSNAHLRTLFYNAAVVVCNFVKKPSSLKEYAERIKKRKASRGMKLVYSIVGAKIARITYAILRDGIPFQPWHGTNLNRPKKSRAAVSFSVSERKTIRRARNCLKRVKDIEITEKVGELAEEMAQMLDLVLEGKS
jgi:transposase